MDHQKTSQRLLAVALSVVMVLGLLPVTALADNTSAMANGEIVAFADLPEATAAQTVAFGTALADLNLPETMTATVRAATATDNPAQDSGEKDTGYTEKTVPVPATWTASPGYDGNMVGVYVFTAKVSGFTVSVNAPTITVTVQGAAVKGTINAFDELADDVRWQNTTEPLFPETLTGTAAGQTVQIPVTWEADHDYDADSPATGLYVFTAKPGEGYSIAANIEAPRITVYILAVKLTRGLMAVAGTSSISVTITTAAQLSEIAMLVNAGRLETFLFNDSNATVSLELKNNLDLSAYGEGWNSGAGWEPIGTASNPFKGIFDGNNNIITGLYIKRTDNYNGLFGYVNGSTVQNLTLENVSISGGGYTGGVVGSVRGGGNVTNCNVTGSISGASYIGGVAGYVTGNMTSCYATGPVSGSSLIGGVAGKVFASGSVTNCYATGSASGSVNCVGGAAGYVTGNMTSCYATGPVSGSSLIGGVAGKVFASGSVTNCYATGSVSGSVNCVGGVVGYVTDDGSRVTNCYATGSVSGIDRVGGVTGFITGGSVTSCAALNPSVRGSNGDSSGRVVGYNNGSGTLSGNAAFAGMTDPGKGKFGSIANSASDNIGGMVGSVSNSVTNCYATGTVVGTGSKVGGVAGDVNNGSVQNCAALNPSLSGTSGVGRVAAQNGGGTLSGNRAFSGMTGGGSSMGADNLDGADITAAQILSASFWTTAGNWNTSSVWDATNVWTVNDGKLPILKNAGGTQSGDGGLYLTVRDIANATVTGSYPYTGSPVTPSLIVSFGSATLAQGTDYTCAVTSEDNSSTGTSAGINAGIVTLILTGKGNFTGTKTVTCTIAKASQSAPAAPTTSSGKTTESSVTLDEISGAEYRCGENGAWQDSPKFTGLTPNTEYSFYVHLKGDANHEPSPASAALSVTTDKSALEGTVSISPNITTAKYGDHLSAGTSIISSNPGALSYQWNRDGSPIGGETSSEHRVGESDVGTQLTVTVTAENYSGSLTSDAVTIERANGPAAPSVTGSYTGNGSAFTYTVDAISGAEYRMDSGNWQDSNAFPNIAPGSSHTFYARIKETATNNAGSAGDTGEVTFAKLPGPAAPTSMEVSWTGNGSTFTCTITPIPGAEYSKDNSNWQDDNTFTGFKVGNKVTFYARMKETGTHEAGAERKTGEITFEKLDDRPAPALNYTVSEGGFPKTITIAPITGAEYKFGNGSWGNTNTYTSNSAETVTLSIRLKATETHNASSEASLTVNTANQNQDTPAAFTLTYESVNDTSYTVTIPKTTDAEYSFDGITWSGINTKTGCLPGDAITGYKRMAAKPGYNASSGTSASVTLPLFQVKTPTALPNGATFTSSQSVTLSCTTAGAGIYYTTDGSTLTAGSTHYTDAFALTATTTVKAIAIKAGMTDSSVLSVTFTKETGGGGGSSPGSDTIPPATATPEKKPDQPVTAAASVTATAGQNGTANASIPDKAITDAISKAQADEKAQGKTANGIGVSITLNNPANTTSLGIVLTQPVLKQLTDAKVQQFEVNGQLLALNLNQTALQEIQKQSSTGDVTITVKPVSISGVRNAYEITIGTVKDGRTVNITSLGKGSVTLSIPYTPASGETAGSLYAVYVDEKSNATRIAGSAYDASSKSVIFTTTHFSLYGVGYTAPSAKFTDISSHWAKDSIDYVVGRGLFAGTSDTTFSPNTVMTRGMLVTALGRLAVRTLGSTPLAALRT